MSTMIIKTGSLLPSLNGATEWLNGSNAIANQQANLILVYFWSVSCPSCHSNMPHLQNLRDKYGPKGLLTVAVHRPMNEGDLNVERVKQAISGMGVTEPCAIDNDHTIGDAFGVSAWPTYFLFDAENKLRRQAKGNFGVRMIEQALIRLFDESTEEKPNEKTLAGVHTN